MNFVNKVILLTEQLVRHAVEPWPLRRPIALGVGAAVGPVEAGWRPVVDSPLVVLVGLTGAGKTTLSGALDDADLVKSLPDRRKLTDAVILGDQADDLDRAARFAATAAFRDAAPGGMGDILAALSVTEPPDQILLFDGLRGAPEIAALAKRSPTAHFIALQVSDDTRAERIAARADRFDREASGDIERAEALVKEESRHYSLEAAIDALAEHAQGRYHVLDAETLGPEQIAAQAKAIIRAAFV